MKLSTHYSRVNLVTSLIILLITGLAYYLVIYYILTEQLDQDLAIEEQEILQYTKLYDKLPDEGNFMNQVVRYHSESSLFERQFSDTEINNPADQKKERARSLITPVIINGKIIKVEIIKSKVRSEDLFRIIFGVSLIIIFLLLVSLTLVNRFILNTLWKPFYVQLNQLRDFNLLDRQEISQGNTSIDEFNELNKAAEILTMRVRKDYGELKTFTDNAAHEMMTPLAVIHSKLDTLLQTGTFTSEQGEILEDIYSGLNRLSRLNQSLLLLSKIENHLIQDKETISLKSLIENKSRQFQELMLAQQISCTLNLGEKHVVMSTYLADILLNNLFSNAIRHNIAGGEIRVLLNDQSLIISNSGKAKPLVPDEIFNRFNKDNSSEGMGLGLAIAQEICRYYHFTLVYEYSPGRHSFTILF